MQKLWLAFGLAALMAGCAAGDRLDIPEGSDVTVEKTDGVAVSGRLVEVKPEQVVIEGRDGARTRVARADIASLRATAAPAAVDARPDRRAPEAPDAAAAPPASPVPPDDARGDAARLQPADAPPVAEVVDQRQERRADRAVTGRREAHEVTIPAGTTLSVELTTPVASDSSRVEDQVRGTLRRAVRADGVEALPAGTAVIGHVTSAQPSAKVKGRASVAFRFNTLDLPGDRARERISTATYTRVAPATRKKDATKIGVGAGAGAVIGGILGGGSGAAKGAVIGGGAGTAAVLATKGDEVRLPAGTPVTVRLTAPLTVRVSR